MLSSYIQFIIFYNAEDVIRAGHVTGVQTCALTIFSSASIATSFDDRYDMFYGSDSTILLRDKKAWMFKEVDAPMLGWEVYRSEESRVGIELDKRRCA